MFVGRANEYVYIFAYLQLLYCFRVVPQTTHNTNILTALIRRKGEHHVCLHDVLNEITIL